MQNKNYMSKDLFNIVIKDIYKEVNKEIIDGVFSILDNFMFITSISLGDLFHDDSESKNVIAASIMYPGLLEIEKIITNLRNKTYNNDIYIISVSWLDTISLNDDIKTSKYSFTNVFGEVNHVIIHSMGYTSFFKNIHIISESRSDLEKENKDYLGINPIILFRGLNWGNIVQLFKLENINLHGGSITMRHKLSIAKYRLSLFLDLIDLFSYQKQYFYDLYTDKNYSSSKYDLTQIINGDNDSYVGQYILINEYLKLNIELTNIKTNILNVESEMNNIKLEKIRLDNSISSDMDNINKIKDKIFSLKTKVVDGKNDKHKAAITGRIQKSNMEIKNLEINNKKDIIKLNSLNRKLDVKSNELNELKPRSEEISKNCIHYNSQIKQLKNNTPKFYNGNSINLGTGNIREYHSLCQIRNYSTNTSIKKLSFDIDSPVYVELQRIINNSNLNAETQIQIEKFLHNQGSLLLKNRIDQSLDINYYKINPYVLDYLKNSIVELEKLIDHYKANIREIEIRDKIEQVEYELILGLSTEDIVSQLLGRFLRIISNNDLFNKNTNCTELACDLGQSLLYSLYSKNYELRGQISNDYGLSQFIKDNYVSLQNLATDPVLIQIGLKLLNFLEEVKLIHTELYILEKDRKNHIYVGNNFILENIGKYINILNLSYKIPMIVKPNKYSRDFKTGKEILGGFLLNDKEYVTPLIIKNSELKDQSFVENENIIFGLVNHLSSVGYKINTLVLDFILEKGIEYDLYIDPNFKHPLENKNKLTFSEKKTLDSFLSKKQLEMNILGLALIFKNVPEFFIPVRIDNRGRVYCMVDYLNYQSVELAKTLLLFSKGEKVFKFDKHSIDYLKIFGANCFGNGIEKKSYNDRVEWVNSNEENILNFRNGILIREAESKLLFIAFCFEYQNYHNSLMSNDSFYVSHFPIQLDATCNGYQHLSLLTGDEPLAGQLNLISGDDKSIPKDFYNFVALKLNDYLKKRLIEEKRNYNSNLENTELKKVENTIKSCERLLKLNLTRKLVKLPIMVKPYNASLFQMVNYIKEQFETVNLKDIQVNESKLFESNKVLYIDKHNKSIKLTSNDLFLLTNTIEQVIYNEFPKLKDFNSYLKRIAEICSILNITITWTLPSGLHVNQYYVDSVAIRLKPFKFKKNTFSLKIKTNKINKTKQMRALMPNLIHSLDAASLSLIVNMFFNCRSSDSEGMNFFSIHDCFAVTANNVLNLINFIKLVYIKIYSEDSYLKKFDQGIIDNIKSHFGDDAFDNEAKTIKVNGLIIDYPDVDQIIIGKIKANKILGAQSIIN
jgi:DNA-dependent RNA polymerase